MAETLIIVLEDVLFQGDRPLDRHVALFKAMCTGFRSVVLSVSTDRDAAKQLLRVNRISYDILMAKEDSVLTDSSWKVSAVRECLGVGWPIGFFIDTDAVAVREVFAMGVTALLLTHHLLRPSWLPGDGPPRAWNDLVEFTEAQQERTAELSNLASSGGRGGRDWSLEER